MREQPASAFDEQAASYEATLDRGLRLTGETSAYFRRARIDWLHRCLGELHADAGSILDFGCGIGSTAAAFHERFPKCRVTGIDPAPGSIAFARSRYGSDRTHFLPSAEFRPEGRFDLAYCNGVFHHIPPGDRPAAATLVRNGLRPGGLFSFWENNPWNPATRYLMRTVPFDRDAIALSVREARRLLLEAGFEILRTDYLFFFPGALKWLRPLEPALAAIPLGAQYHLLARRPVQA